MWLLSNMLVLYIVVSLFISIKKNHQHYSSNSLIYRIPPFIYIFLIELYKLARAGHVLGTSVNYGSKFKVFRNF
jgi:hypothetical protein